MMRPATTTTLFALLLLAVPGSALAQEFSIGADLVNRYVWRGYDFGESFSVQPTLEYSSGNFSIGSWASYSIAADGAGANEHDLYLGYSAGPVSFGVTDYFFPTDGTEFFAIESHTFEPYVSLASGNISLLGALAINPSDDANEDTELSPYVELGYGAEVAGAAVALTAGVVLGEASFYGTETTAFTNLGIGVSKALPITPNFALPVAVSYIINPYTERTFLVFGISI